MKDPTKRSGMKIELNDRYQFHVPELEKCFDSFRLAEDAIEKATKAKTIADKKKLDLAVFNGKGESCTITSVHAGTGRVIVNPKQGDTRYGEDSSLYVGVPVVAEAIAYRNEAKKKLLSAESILSRYRIDSHFGYGFDSSKLVSSIASLEKAYANNLQRAKSKTLEAELKDAE